MGRFKATSKNIDEKALLTTRPGVKYVGQVGKASGRIFGEVEWCWLYLVTSIEHLRMKGVFRLEQWQPEQVTVAMLERNLLRLHQNFNEKVGCTDWLSHSKRSL